ncbi:MAG TPA: hypothetical protein VH592_19180 [Gemmataceae bacterium]|jgi:hypothetical protein
MNLFLALFWLICAVMLLVYEHHFGPAAYRMRLGGYNLSWAWLLFLMVFFNLHRWRRMRFYRARQRAAEIARANEEREQRRPSTAIAKTPDPNFNFTDEPPAPSNRGITDQPPSKN